MNTCPKRKLQLQTPAEQLETIHWPCSLDATQYRISGVLFRLKSPIEIYFLIPVRNLQWYAIQSNLNRLYTQMKASIEKKTHAETRRAGIWKIKTIWTKLEWQKMAILYQTNLLSFFIPDGENPSGFTNNLHEIRV